MGAKADLVDRRVSFETALYYMDWKDVQTLTSVPFVGCIGGRLDKWAVGQRHRPRPKRHRATGGWIGARNQRELERS
jgi:hypothetical protein